MENINRIILINKEKGYTSHDVVAKVKKLLNIKKVGHTGTLDPNATGVLPLLLNDGTKISKYLIEHDKEYEVVLKLGIKTDTADGEGKILKESEVKKEIFEKVEETLKSFIGKQEQIPPMYSAIKVNGKKLYEYARSGENIEVEPRNIEIYSINLQNIDKKENEISFKVSCSKGTYIRTLCEDIASKLGTVGFMKELNRTKVGSFKIEDAIKIDKIKDNSHKIISIEKFFENKEKINLSKKELDKFLNGVKIFVDKKDDIYNIYENNTYIGIGVINQKKLKRDVIIDN